MGIKTIEKPFWLYSLLKHVVDFWHNKVFYRDVILLNTHNIPEEGPLIFTPNHQNALMDALALLCNVDRRLVFMARSDIFQKPPVAAILYFLRILPIYRIRDGYESLKKNKDIFKKTMDVLTDKDCALVILPEGNHSGIRRLRPLKKGFARIAFQTEEAEDYKLGVKIVPVGIDYDNYEDFQSRLIINFGKPIAVADYTEQYKEAPAIAINMLKNALSEQMKSLIINIKTEEYYELVNALRIMYGKKLAESLPAAERRKNLLSVQQQIVKSLQKATVTHPDKIKELDKKVKQYLLSLKNNGLPEDGEIKNTSFTGLLVSAMGLILLLPVFIYGAINNFVPLGLSSWAKGKIKDPQFKSSFLFVVSLVAFPLFHVLQTVIFAFYAHSWYWTAAYFVSVPLSGVFLVYYNGLVKKFRRRRRIYQLFRKRKDFMEQLQNDYEEIMAVTASFVRTDQSNRDKQTS